MRQPCVARLARGRRRSRSVGASLAAIAVGILASCPAAASAAGCFPSPSSCSYPDATNTGVPPGTTLTPSGSRTLSTNGQVLSGVDLTGTVTVTGDDVTIRDSRLHTNSGGSGSTVITLGQGAEGFTLEDSEVFGNGSKTNAPQSGVWNHYNNPGARVIGSYVHGSPDNWEGRVDLIKDSYLIVDARYPGAHSENVYICGSTAIVEHSTLYNESDETSLIFGDGICGRGNTVSVTDSMLAGGGYMLQPNAKGVSAPVTITGNRVGRCLTPSRQDSGGGYVCSGGADAGGYWPRGGHYGISADLGQSATWSGNVWDDNGQAVCASGNSGCAGAGGGGQGPPPPPPPGEPEPGEPAPAPPPETPSEPAAGEAGGPVVATPIPVTAVWRAPRPRAGRLVTLDGTGSTAGGSPTCVWTFDRRNGSRAAAPRIGCKVKHRFRIPGLEYVTLSVTAADGSSASSRQPVLVRDARRSGRPVGPGQVTRAPRRRDGR
jgi:hypothetical protein